MPRTGRPRRVDPVTAAEAVAELRRYGVDPYVTPGGNVGLTVADVNILTAKLRRRKPSTRSPRRLGVCGESA